MKYSLTLGGVLVALGGTLLLKLGFSDTCSNEIITNIPLVVGSVMTWIGRVRQGDVNIFGFKEE